MRRRPTGTEKKTGRPGRERGNGRGSASGGGGGGGGGGPPGGGGGTESRYPAKPTGRERRRLS